MNIFIMIDYMSTEKFIHSLLFDNKKIVTMNNLIAALPIQNIFM